MELYIQKINWNPNQIIKAFRSLTWLLLHIINNVTVVLVRPLFMKSTVSFIFKNTGENVVTQGISSQLEYDHPES